MALRMLLTVAIALSASLAPAGMGLAQSRDDHSAKFNQIWTTLGEKFYDPEMRGLDWNAVASRYRQRAAEAKGRQAFQRVLSEMLAELKVSHLAYYTADDFDYYFFRQVFMPDQPGIECEHIGMMGSPRNEGFVVQATFEGGPAAKAGIEVGDRLLTMEREPVTSAGTFRGKASKAVRLIVIRGRDEREIEVTPVKQTAVAAFAEATRGSARVIEREGRSIGYVHLWCCTHKEILHELERAVRLQFKDTDGIVLDLRDGYGGYPGWFDYAFFQPAMELKIISRNREATVERFGNNRPLAVLINAGSRSAKELFAYEMKKTGRAKLVGATTAGFFLGAGAAAIGDDGLLMFPHSDLEIDGQRLEGVGVVPDVAVAPHKSYLPGDAQLSAAVADVVAQIRQAAGNG